MRKLLPVSSISPVVPSILAREVSSKSDSVMHRPVLSVISSAIGGHLTSTRPPYQSNVIQSLPHIQTARPGSESRVFGKRNPVGMLASLSAVRSRLCPTLRYKRQHARTRLGKIVCTQSVTCPCQVRWPRYAQLPYYLVPCASSLCILQQCSHFGRHRSDCTKTQSFRDYRRQRELPSSTEATRWPRSASVRESLKTSSLNFEVALLR